MNHFLVPTWLHFPSQNPPKSHQKSILKGIDFLIAFGIDFLMILAPSWAPTWGHVGHIFAQNGGGLCDAAPLFVGSMLFFDFLALLAPSWRHLGSILEGSGLHFGGFGPPFWRFMGSLWKVSGDDLGPMCIVILVPFKAVFFKASTG